MTAKWIECWDAAPELHALLKESKTLESARNKVARYIEAREWIYSCDVSEVETWEYVLLQDIPAVLILNS